MCQPVTIVTHRMGCEEKARLVEEHHHAALAYSQAARTLNGKMRNTPASEYKKLREVMEEARTKSQEAHAAVQRHILEHGC